MSSRSQMFSGCFVALITPMLANEEVDHESLTSLVKWHIDQGTDGLVVLGTTAETATLTLAEQKSVLETVIAANEGQLPLIIGNGSNSTRHTVELTKLFDEYAIDGFLTVTPYYNRPNQGGIVAHFEKVAQATDKPIILYNVPPRTGVDLTNESVIKLMAIKNIVGIKDATGDLSRVSVFKQADKNFALFSGDDATSREFIEQGGHGTISVTGNVAPQKLAKMINAQISGDSVTATELDGQLKALHNDLFIEPNPVPSKWALAHLGKISSDTVRLPLISMELSNQERIKQALQLAE